ncbi:MAG: hypothetical protein KatS3mg034_1438 [Vicingaceae bacterium]|nr:MAG: hypothetical protein KatS3mg034_1438 [Vicingaceae bacterium]
MPGKRFYQHLAHLFYAIASADNMIKEKELQTIIQDVKSVWAPEEKEVDEFGEDTALQIITVVDWLVENGIKSEHAYKDFEEYYHEHTSLFNNERKNKILKTCEKIAQSFASVNNKEKIMLEKVKKLFSANA